MNSLSSDLLCRPGQTREAAGQARRKARVLVLNVHPLVRRGLEALINAERDMEVCAEMAAGMPAVDDVVRLRPDVVIVDFSRPDGGGLVLIQRIRKAEPGIRIVATALCDRPEYTARAMEAGAAACVLKLGVASRVLEAIRRVSRTNGAVTTRPMRTSYADFPVAPRRGGPPRLETVERQVVELMGQGMLGDAIAVRLHLSTAAVQEHQRVIRTKLKLRSPAQLVAYCIRAVQRSASSPAAAR